MSTLWNRLTDVVSAVLDVDPAAVSANSSPSSIESWDSVAHVQLMLALESEFGISFTMDQMATLDSIGRISQAIQELEGKP